MHEAGSVALLQATGQLNVLKLAAIVAGCGFLVASCAAIALANDLPRLALAVFLAGTIALVVAPWVALRKIKCPSCGAHWLQHALGGRPIGDWVGWLVTFDACPECKATAKSLAAGGLPSNTSFERTREK
jgi:hypothetical protein